MTDFLGLTMNWHYSGCQTIDDFTSDKVAELSALRKELGLDGIPLAYDYTVISGMSVKCTCNGSSSAVSGGCWRYYTAVISIRDEIHMRPEYNGNPPREWVLNCEKEHANDTKNWVAEQRSASRWNEFEVNEQNNCRYSDESECESQVRKKLKEQIDAAIIELGKKSNEKWDKSGKHTWRGGKK